MSPWVSRSRPRGPLELDRPPHARPSGARRRRREPRRGDRSLPRGELALDELARPVAELREFGLAGNPDVLLVETPYAGWPLDMGNRLATLQAAGIVPVLAHPERNPEVQRNPGLVARLVDDGTLV